MTGGTSHQLFHVITVQQRPIKPNLEFCQAYVQDMYGAGYVRVETIARRLVVKRSQSFFLVVHHRRRTTEGNVYGPTEDHEEESSPNHHAGLGEVSTQRIYGSEAHAGYDGTDGHQYPHVVQSLRLGPRKLVHRQRRAQSLQQHEIEYDDEERHDQRPARQVIGFDALPRFLLRLDAALQHGLLGGDPMLFEEVGKEQAEVNDRQEHIYPTRGGVHVELKFAGHEPYSVVSQRYHDCLKCGTDYETEHLEK